MTGPRATLAKDNARGFDVQMAEFIKHKNTYLAVKFWIPAARAQKMAPRKRTRPTRRPRYDGILSANIQVGMAIARATTYSGAVINLGGS